MYDSYSAAVGGSFTYATTGTQYMYPTVPTGVSKYICVRDTTHTTVLLCQSAYNSCPPPTPTPTPEPTPIPPTPTPDPTTTPTSTPIPQVYFGSYNSGCNAQGNGDGVITLGVPSGGCGYGYYAIIDGYIGNGHLDFNGGTIYVSGLVDGDYLVTEYDGLGNSAGSITITVFCSGGGELV